MAELAESERRKRTSPGGIIPLGRRGGGGQAGPQEHGTLLLQHRRAQPRTQLPPPYQVPSVGNRPDRLHGGDEGGIGGGFPRRKPA